MSFIESGWTRWQGQEGRRESSWDQCVLQVGVSRASALFEIQGSIGPARNEMSETDSLEVGIVNSLCSVAVIYKLVKSW
jgi:hypothetical protein